MPAPPSPGYSNFGSAPKKWAPGIMRLLQGPEARTFFKPCPELTQGHEHCLPRAILQHNRRCIATGNETRGLPVELEGAVLELQPRISGRSGVKRNACITGC